MELLTSCPVCSESVFESYTTCKDYTVSGEKFEILHCKACGFKFTNPRPTVAEIGVYYDSPEYISHSNSSKGLMNIIYQKVRKYTVSQKVKLISSLLNGSIKKVLDIGCGTGDFLNACAVSGWDVAGVEPGDSARNFAIENYNLNVIEEFGISTLLDKEYSIITLWHVLEHVHELNERIQELKRLLADDGTLLIAVPNCASHDAEYYKEHWAAYDVPRHLYHFSPKNIKELFAKHGMQVIKTLPMVFDAYYVSLLSEKHKNPSVLNYLSAIIRGFISNKRALKNGNNYSSVIYIIKKVDQIIRK